MKIIFYDYYRSDVKTAVKAREDVRLISEKNGYKAIPLFCKDDSFFKKILSINKAIRGISKQLKMDNVNYVIIQYPYRKKLINYILKKINKKAKVIFLIHDVEYIRNCDIDIEEIKLFNKADFVIAHNEKMIGKLIADGVSPVKLFSLELFDYISDGSLSLNPVVDKNIIIFAGFLGSIKSGFIYNINPTNYCLSLYGINYEETNSANIIYNGSFPSNELIKNLKGHYGLVWDGNSVLECAGNYGNYLKYNNPHKTSLYISAGLPIVIWKEAALSSFINDNKIGIVIDNLYDLEKLPKNDSDEYLLMKKNVLNLRDKLNEGYFLTSVLKKIEEK